MADITFITGNQHKVEALEKWLGFSLKHHKLDLDELQELDPKLVVEHKAKQAYEILKTAVLIEDTALWFHSLGRLPGTFVKWFIEEIGNDGLCRLLKDFDDRSATASVIYGYYDGQNVQTFEGTVDGTINDLPQGESGFGWDPIFIPEGADKTYAQMHADGSDSELSHYSVRNKAVAKLKEFLDIPVQQA